jgi:rubrerythrin
MTKTLQELLAIGIKAEIEAIAAYSELAKNIDNYLLADRFESLANDEARHKKILEDIYAENFPGKQVILPEHSGVPKVSTTVTKENSINEILLIAMDAEKKAENYYRDLSEQMKDQNKKDLLNYLANIENGHYYFLKVEFDHPVNK